jgi:glycosyltransferase involved in cell wall biosynthesis
MPTAQADRSRIGPAGGQKRRILFVVNNPDFFVSHRLPLAIAARAAGFEAAVASPQGDGVAAIAGNGFDHHPFPLNRSGKHPLQEARSVVALYRIFRAVRPDIVHTVTIKPALYGGVAARLTNVPALVCAVSGLGYLFIGGPRTAFRRRLVMQLYRFAFGHRNLRVVFQNESDRAEFAGTGVADAQVALIPGSGVDLDAFQPAPEPPGIPLVVLPARLLRDKGVCEFVEAARILRRSRKAVRFVLVGLPDPGNPASLDETALRAWQQEGAVEWWGFRTDMPEVLRSAHLVVLPSYREGFSKVLIEAAAAGRAVVTTDVPGCRDAILPERTGLLVPPRDPVALAGAIGRLVEDAELRGRMGLAGRELAERAFSIDRVVEQHLRLYEALCPLGGREAGG